MNQTRTFKLLWISLLQVKCPYWTAILGDHYDHEFIPTDGAAIQAAGKAAGLTIGQVQYWLVKFHREGLMMLPEFALEVPESAAAGEVPGKK